MGGKGSGGARPNTGFNNAKVDPDLNHRVIEHGKEIMALAPIDITDAEQVDARFLEFLQICDNWKIKPAVTSCAMSFGLDRHQLYQVVKVGAVRVAGYTLTRESIRAFKNAYGFLESTFENYWNGYRKAKNVIYEYGIDCANENINYYTHGTCDAYYKGFRDAIIRTRKKLGVI